jgi:drug/metabolite transporter (DMT)-like permease
MRHHAHVPLSAILLITGSALSFTVLDAIVKHLTQSYPVPLLVWARYAVQALAMVLWLAPSLGRGMLRTRQPRLQILRAALLPFSSLCFFSALKHLPLAEATAINFSTPVLVVLLAVYFLGERMTHTRVAFVVAGVAGMLLIVRPGSEVFQGGALFALGAAAFYGVFQILTRKLAAEDPRVTLFYPAIVGTAITTAVLPWFWADVAMPWTHVALIVLAGLLGTFGHFLFILAFQRGPVSALTPFTYTQLVWATLIGWGAFGSLPDAWTVAGMAVIAVSGLLIAVHERRRALRAVQEPPAID